MIATTRPVELYACLYINEFLVQALLRLRSWLRDRPCVVMDGDPPFTKGLLAEHEGASGRVANNMTQVEVDAFPSVTVLTRSRKEEEATRKSLFECVGVFSPHVEEENEKSAFLCVIDIAGTEKLYGVPEILSHDLLASR